MSHFICFQLKELVSLKFNVNVKNLVFNCKYYTMSINLFHKITDNTCTHCCVPCWCTLGRKDGCGGSLGGGGKWSSSKKYLGGMGGGKSSVSGGL